MAAANVLLEKMTGVSSPYGPLLLPLADLFTAFARSYWTCGIPVEPHPTTLSSCLIAASDQVSAYCLTGSEGWADYDAIRAAFDARNRRRRESAEGGGAKTSPLPRELVGTGIRLILRDSDAPLECLLSSEPVYPRRAWVGKLHPGIGSEVYYVLAGMLNSALGLVLYRRLSRSAERSGHDLRKAVLIRLKIPFLSYDAETYQRVALLSYRLHCLLTASHEVALPASVQDEDIPNHKMQLLSELVRLYGFEDREARALVENVLPRGAADLPGVQRTLSYRPKEALASVRIQAPEMPERYEQLKEHARRRQLSPSEHRELEELRAVLTWEHRINNPNPVPPTAKQTGPITTAEAAMRRADHYLSEAIGQRMVSQTAQRISAQVWEIQIGQSSPPRSRRSEHPASMADTGGLGFLSRLWVNVITGAVSDNPGKARDATAPLR